MIPRVFVSSTYVDLKHVRERLSEFIESIGYQAVLFEKGGIGFDWQKPLDESCYESVAESDVLVLIIGGRYGSPASEELERRARNYNSVTRKEYTVARNYNIPIHIFIESQVLAEYKTFVNNRGNSQIKYASVDSYLIFDLIDEIFRQNLNNYVISFDRMEDITRSLKVQWASMLKTHLKERARRIKRNLVKINSFKLFYFRNTKKISVRDLAKAVGVNRQKIRFFERVQHAKPKFDGFHDRYFPDCEFSVLAKIESALDCPGKLRAGTYDDFLAHFIEYYIDNSRKQSKFRTKFPFLPFETKVVVFDFDGTIARHPLGWTTWELIWEKLGYSINQCAEYHTQFRRGMISHSDWCAITLEKFRSGGLNQKQFFRFADELEIVPGFRELIENLLSRKIKLHIVSGSIIGIIRETLGDLATYFDSIKANDIVFDSQGNIKDIIGTRFDFQGKADYIKEIVLDYRCSPMDVLFVGNAGNDRWASNAGVRTLCVNPTSTDPDNPKEWTDNIRMMKDMREILKFVF